METSSLRSDRNARTRLDELAAAVSANEASEPGGTDSERRTPLHEIRAVRDSVASALRRVRQMRVTHETREHFVSDFAAIDAALVRLYRQERFGERKAYYDDVIATETNAPERLYLDLSAERPHTNGRAKSAIGES